MNIIGVLKLDDFTFIRNAGVGTLYAMLLCYVLYISYIYRLKMTDPFRNAYPKILRLLVVLVLSCSLYVWGEFRWVLNKHFEGAEYNILDDFIWFGFEGFQCIINWFMIIQVRKILHRNCNTCNVTCCDKCLFNEERYYGRRKQ